jgi:hypothetical protein
MITLHVYRFPGEHATLAVHETPERTGVFVRMEGDSSQFEEFGVYLTAVQWRRLCSFDPFRADKETGVLRAITFMDAEHGDLLEVSETPARHGVQVRMRHALSPDADDCLVAELDRTRWGTLIGLDLLHEVAEESSGPVLVGPDVSTL